MSERMNEWWYRDSPITEPTSAAGICYSKHGWILDRFHLKSSVDIFILQRAHWCFNIPWNRLKATLEFTLRPLFSCSESTYSPHPHSCYLFYRFSSTKDVTRKTGQAVLKPFCTIVSVYSCDIFSFLGLTHLFQTSMPMLNVQLGAFSMDASGFPFFLFLDILFRLTCYFTCSILSGEYSSIIGPSRRSPLNPNHKYHPYAMHNTGLHAYIHTPLITFFSINCSGLFDGRIISYHGAFWSFTSPPLCRGMKDRVVMIILYTR